MIRLRKGEVLRVLSARPGLLELLVAVEGTERRAVAYPDLSGPVEAGDRVTLNTTATVLGLGSGGYDFVVAVDGERALDPRPEGHLMKLRYTPLQVKVLSVEEEESPYREAVAACESLAGLPVVVGTLHSQLAPACLALRHFAGDGCRVVYVMTDGAALPLAWSRTVARLREEGLLAATVTVGHAFGGDLEAVNKYSGLLAAKAAARADVIVVAMGPGIVGTGTSWGHSGVEQGEWVNAAETLGGRVIAVPRLSFADQRPRHWGVSHQFLTALSRVARAAATVSLPSLGGAEEQLVRRQLEEAFARGESPAHAIVPVDTGFFAGLLAGREWAAQSMGRGFAGDPAAFLGAAAAGRLAAEWWRSGQGVSG
jgi:hypothetical protein